jgi:hypothetical protein
VLEQGAPGNQWQPDQDGIPQSGHTQKFYYETNTFEEVRLWKAGASDTLQSSGYYLPGELYKNSIESENEYPLSFTIEFKDKLGKVVLKVSQSDTTQLKTY